MKYFTMICSIIGIFGLTGITTSFAEERQDQTIHQMSERVQKTRLQEFLQVIEAHSWKAPEIW